MKKPYVLASIAASWVTLWLGASASRAGLYDNPDADKQLTGGDLYSYEYWDTDYDMRMLDLALKTHQPEGAIGLKLVTRIKVIDQLLGKYPKHETLLKWKAKVDDVLKKIGPDFDRRATFTAECPWGESNFEQLWFNFHWGKMAYERKDWHQAMICLSNCEQNFPIMLAKDRMNNYPEDLRKWAIEAKAEFDKMYPIVKIKESGGVVPTSNPDADTKTTSGDLYSYEYWDTDYDMRMLDLALKTHQPEGAIGLKLVTRVKMIDQLLDKYPKHEKLLKWKAKVDEVLKKIGPDFNRMDTFNAECPWGESNFEQLWFNFHWGKMAYERKDWNQAMTCFSNCAQNFPIMLAKDRMNNYPEDLRKWTIDAKAEFDKMYPIVKKKWNGG